MPSPAREPTAVSTVGTDRLFRHPPCGILEVEHGMGRTAVSHPPRPETIKSATGKPMLGCRRQNSIGVQLMKPQRLAWLVTLAIGASGSFALAQSPLSAQRPDATLRSTPDTVVLG